jgi:hypothetical protein
MRLTQQHIGRHLDLSQKSVSQFLAKEGLDCSTNTLDEIRVAYLRKLRAAASDSQQALTHEKILTERVDRELKIYQLEQKKSQLINLAQLEAEMTKMVDAIRAEMLKRNDQLKVDLDARYGIDIGIGVVNGYVFQALKHFGRYDVGNHTSE